MWWAAAAGAALLAALAWGCGSCHTFGPAGSIGRIGPSLNALPRYWAPEQVRQAIVAPPAGLVMPSDFGRRLSGEELDDLVALVTYWYWPHPIGVRKRVRAPYPP
jgi:mono/diheme cytochrome c family protein